MVKKVYAFQIATSIAIIFVVLATIASELSPGIKEVFKGIGGHHWVGKGIASAVLFSLIALLYTGRNNFERGNMIVLYSTICGFLAIFLFYILHFSKVI